MKSRSKGKTIQDNDLSGIKTVADTQDNPARNNAGAREKSYSFR